MSKSLIDEVPSLEAFRSRGLITEVMSNVKSGKEATVYCCRACPSTGFDLLAAKVYRPLESRSFRRDAVYHEGRVITDARARRAFKKKTRFGRGVQFGLWMLNEFEALKVLHAAGADVPQPVAQAGAAILMEYVGDDKSPAPLLKHVSLSSREARRLFDILMCNVELFLTYDRVHGDLSSFNVMYWKGRAVIIDFPQCVDSRSNPSAFRLLMRDIESICRHFRRHGIEADAHTLSSHLWMRYLNAKLQR